jgi:hypothetical protein
MTLINQDLLLRTKMGVNYQASSPSQVPDGIACLRQNTNLSKTFNLEPKLLIEMNRALIIGEDMQGYSMHPVLLRKLKLDKHNGSQPHILEVLMNVDE